MYTIMFLICFIIGIITTYKLKDTILKGRDLFLPFAFLSIYKKGYEDDEEVFLFAISILCYIFCLFILSFIWFITIPILITYIIIKKFLKKKS